MQCLQAPGLLLEDLGTSLGGRAFFHGSEPGAGDAPAEEAPSEGAPDDGAPDDAPSDGSGDGG